MAILEHQAQAILQQAQTLVTVASVQQQSNEMMRMIQQQQMQLFNPHAQSLMYSQRPPRSHATVEEMVEESPFLSLMAPTSARNQLMQSARTSSARPRTDNNNIQRAIGPSQAAAFMNLLAQLQHQPQLQ
jgi:hypothetical protein